MSFSTWEQSEELRVGRGLTPEQFAQQTDLTGFARGSGKAFI